MASWLVICGPFASEVAFVTSLSVLPGSTEAPVRRAFDITLDPNGGCLSLEVEASDCASSKILRGLCGAMED